MGLLRLLAPGRCWSLLASWQRAVVVGRRCRGGVPACAGGVARLPSSNQLHALTTVGQVGCLAGLVGIFGCGGTVDSGRLIRLGGLVLSAFTVVTLGMPLGATKLYLFGISATSSSAPGTSPGRTPPPCAT